MKIITRLRLWLAQLVAPAGAEVHDPDDTLCSGSQELLEAALYGDFRRGPDGGVLFDVTVAVDDLVDFGALVNTDTGYELTESGKRELARLWGPGRIPPWSGGHYRCDDHGIYEAAPGDFVGCPNCPPSLVLVGASR